MGKFQLTIMHADGQWSVEVCENYRPLFKTKNCNSEQHARDLGRAFIEGIFYMRGER